MRPGRYIEAVAELGCVICRRIGRGYSSAEIHHVAEGSGKRSDYAIVGLCPEHHRGALGYHGLGERKFCAMYSVPWRREYGLLIWVNEDMYGRER